MKKTYTNTKLFINDLIKYSENENIEINIQTKKWAIIEKTESEGEWNGNEYTIYADVYQKGAIMGYDEGLEEFLSMISNYQISDLNGEKFYNLNLLESYGGDVNITKVDWEHPLTEDQKEELEDYGGEYQLFDEGDWAVEEVVFKNGDIIEIKIIIDDNEYVLSNS